MALCFEIYARLTLHTYIFFMCQDLFIDFRKTAGYKKMMNERKPFTTSLNVKILKNVKKLAIDLDKGVNDLLEEAMQDLLQKYDKAPPEKK